MANDLTQFPNAMYDDPTTGKPAQKTANRIIERATKTIQTHNAVSIGASGSSVTSWLDIDGYDKVAFSLLNDGATSNSLEIDWSHDGITAHGFEVIMTSAVRSRGSAITDIKARYIKVTLKNADTSSHTMSAWAYLKA